MHTRIDRRAATEPAEHVGGSQAWRWAILAAALVVAVLCALLLAAQWQAVRVPCVLPVCSPPQLTESAMAGLADLGLSDAGWATLTLLLSSVLVAASLSLALLVAWRGSGHAARIMPIVLLLATLAPINGFTPWPWLSDLLNGASTLSFFLLVSLFPDGRFRPRWTVIPVVLAAAWVVVTRTPAISTAVARNAEPWSALYGLVFALALGGILVSQMFRYRQSSPADRHALLLLGVVLLVFVGPGATFSVYQGTEPETAGIGTLIGSAASLMSNLFIVLIYAVIALAAIRDGAYGIRLTLNRVLLGTLGLGIVFAVYTGTAAIASLVLAGWLPQALAGAVAALALFIVFRPLVRGIDRLVYGDADDPDRLTARLAATLAAADDSGSVVPELLDTLAARLRLPWIELNAPGATMTPPDRHASIELDPAKPGAAVLTVGLRIGQRRLSHRDRVALRAAVPTLVSGLATVRLTDELQESRRRVVAAAEEERRALRRELHDGLGPTLAAARHRIAAARTDSGDSNPEGHLARAEEQLAEAVETIRSLARRLRPPALDEHGLPGALHNAAADLGLDATVTVPPTPVPDLLEVGIYRIAVEALMNVARHAGTTRVTIKVEATRDGIALNVWDDGIGIRDSQIGVGITSMRERAAELGGRVIVAAASAGGTLVSASVPLPVRGAEWMS